MKRWTVLLAVALLVAVAVMPAAAAPATPKLSGPHWELHLIGSPKGISGDDSSGHSIMIPLKNAGKDGVETLSCEGDEVIFDRDPDLYFTDQEPAGAKLYWQLGPTFEILDRDATDGSARIQIPWDADSASGEGDTTPDLMDVDVWVRIHGKPGTCMKATGWAVDPVDLDGDPNTPDTNYYFLAGSIQLNRKTGKAAWTNVNDLFDVTWCPLGTITNSDGTTSVGCVGDVMENVSVFDDQFSSYFWNIVNNGARNVEIRLYPH